MNFFDEIQRITKEHCERMGYWPKSPEVGSPLYESLRQQDYDDRYDYPDEPIRISNHDGGEYAEELRLDNAQRARDMRDV